MSPLIYKVLHILGVLLAFTALGGAILRALAGNGDEAGRKMIGATHGIALLLILISGFGMIAKYSYGFPLWVLLKIAIWLLIGASIALIRRMPSQATLFWFALPILGGIAGYLALYKPF